MRRFNTIMVRLQRVKPKQVSVDEICFNTIMVRLQLVTKDGEFFVVVERFNTIMVRLQRGWKKRNCETGC